MLFKDELLPPSKWPLAHIKQLHPGGYGLSRVATIQTATGTYKRPIAQLIWLPVDDNATALFSQISTSMAGGIVMRAPTEMSSDLA